MKELVDRLAQLQAEREDIIEQEKDASMDIDMKIDALEGQILVLKDDLAKIQRPYVEAVASIDKQINDVKAMIIDTWDGEKKTMKFDVGTLKFRTTSKLEIHYPEMLIVDIYTHLHTGSEVMKYISGFNKTATKKYLTVHPQDPDVVEMVPSTSVKLERGN